MPHFLETLYEAQKIAFAPFLFKAVSAALQTEFLPGIVHQKSPKTPHEWAETLGLTPYAVDVMADILVSARVLARREDGTLESTRVGDLLVLDEMTRVNFFFTDRTNYAGLEKTLDALLEGRPAGLSAFNGDWKTIYPHLPDLPEDAQKAWFAFDHFHSDRAYRAAIECLDKLKGFSHLVDIGGNTGRFTKLFLETHPNARATFVDLPAQIENLARHAELECARERIDTVALDWLTDAPLTGTEEADLYWMSQFLDCFSLDEARSILLRTARAMKAGAKLAVLEPLVDEQRHEAAALSLAATSLYFTVMANGNSRFFHGGELRRLCAESGLRIVSETPNLGISHTLFILEKDSK